MNAKIKAQWLEALRSGKYQQGRGYLRIGNQFCCLGVLCDLHAKAVHKKWELCQDDSLYSYGDHTSILPNKVRTWAGLTKTWAELTTDAPVLLSALNDAGKSFKQIANVIEAQL